ncbi:hypothetical protein [Marinicella gelatinilytica]|uniref:hypothetical protein n=1 Tax=Marinicella gelatinilytica TaxID=2996017 RepID=UPI002260D38D|nr:hypothetical protein [Marinicella gelatinilytica]MCX7544906.1 hypothetical protein [Marinicella gelatinilytica]
MKKLFKALLILIGMMAVLFVVAVIVNLSVFDEELLPEVQAIKDLQAKPYQADNAYPALIAMSYYPDEPYQSATKKIRERLNQNISTNGQDFLTTHDQESLKSLEVDDSQLTDISRCNTRKEKNCVIKYLSNLNKQHTLNKATQTLVNRYEQLIDYSHFSEATQMEFDTVLPPLSTPLRTQRVFLLTQWLKNKTNFVPLIIKDLNFWRMMLKNNSLLITKMISNAAIHNDIQILAYAIHSGGLNDSELIELNNQITGLSQKEKGLYPTLQSEMKGSMGFLDAYKNENQDLIGKLLYQPQATLNLHYIANIKPLNSIDDLDSKKIYDSLLSNTWPEKPNLKSAVSLYNPTGKLFLNTYFGPPMYHDYFARMHDLNAMLVLLKLRIELALNNDQNIATLIKNSNHKNPYTEKSFDYDAEAQTIGFACLDKTSVCEISL